MSLSLEHDVMKSALSKTRSSERPRQDEDKKRTKVRFDGFAELEKSSVVLWGPGALIRGGHVVQVAAVFVPAVVQGLALKKCRGWGQVGDWGHGEVVVGVRRGVLGCAWEVLLGCLGMWKVVRGG